jgi:hypothetical protein
MSGWPSGVFGCTYAFAGVPFGFAAAAGACAATGPMASGQTAIAAAKVPTRTRD